VTSAARADVPTALASCTPTIAKFLARRLVLRRRFKPPTVLADIEKNKGRPRWSSFRSCCRGSSTNTTRRRPSRTSRRCGSCSCPARSSGPIWRPGRSRISARSSTTLYGLDGDRVRDHREAEGPVDQPVHGRTRRQGCEGAGSSTTTATTCRRARSGRIFVGQHLPVRGATPGGGHKQIIDGLMSSGDVGYFDEHNLLYVSGR
jgi:fatty-acyl-CoA synthase